MLKKNSLRSNEQGFASIVIALVLIIVLALLTVGFAELARHEQQNALGKQLANQAYYAAESGINDAYKDIQSGFITTDGTGTTAKADDTNCMRPDPPYPGLIQYHDVSTDYGVSYTCLLVDLTPPSLVKNMNADSEWSTTFSTVDSDNNPTVPYSLIITWNSQRGKKPYTGAGTPFTPSTGWTYPAVLQISITPLNQLNRPAMVNSTYTIFGYPSTASGNMTAYNADFGSQGQIVPGNCSTSTNTCQVIITGFNALSPPATAYLIHTIDYYDDSQVAITAKADTSGTSLNFENGQAVIDVTGKARNVLKRLQAHVPVNPPYDVPGGVEARNICKFFTTDPVSGTQSKSGSLSGYPAGFDTTTPCNLN